MQVPCHVKQQGRQRITLPNPGRRPGKNTSTFPVSELEDSTPMQVRISYEHLANSRKAKCLQNPQERHMSNGVERFL